MHRSSSLLALAFAVSANAGEPIALEAPVHSIVGDGETLIALGEARGVVMDLASGQRRPVELASTVAALVEVSGATHLATCTDTSLSLWTWPAREAVATFGEGCEALGDSAGSLVAVGKDVVVLGLSEGALVEVRRESRPEGTPLLATGGGLIALGIDGKPGITELSSRGVSTLATGGPIGGLGYRDGLWVWSSVEDDVITGQLRAELLTAREPRALQVTDLNGDGVDDVVVRHADRVGLLRDETELVLPWRTDVRAVGVDGRACPSVWVASQTELREFPGECGVVASVSAPVPAEPAPAAEQAPGEIILVTLDGRTIPEIAVTVGQRVRVQLEDAGGRGMSFAARGGPVGFVVLPDGLIDYKAQAEHVGTYALSVRMTSGMTRRSATVRLVVRGEGESSSDPEGDSAAASPQTGDPRLVPRRSGSIERCTVGFGAAAALSNVRLSWNFIGRSLVLSGSPALTMACEGPGKVRWWVRGSTAPTLFYVPPADRATDQGNPHVAAASLGFAVGSENASIGPYATAGIVLAGFGVRAAFLPFELRGRRRHGPTLDAVYYVPSMPAGGLRLTWNLEL
ncbi:MAG: hypothetical protein EP330_06395 [Deltaproteobacteria bacterium]|nr:MAG: hypothetical protein EP330_06395 [Deltaproteobacteria bacterium]